MLNQAPSPLTLRSHRARGELLVLVLGPLVTAFALVSVVAAGAVAGEAVSRWPAPGAVFLLLSIGVLATRRKKVASLCASIGRFGERVTGGGDQPRRVMTGFRAVTAEVAAYVLTIAYLFKSVLFDINEKMLSVGGDAEWYMGLGERIGREMARLSPTMTISSLIAPHGLDLRLVDGLFGFLICGMWNLLVGPVFAYNLALITATILNLGAGRYAAAVVTTDRASRAVAAIAFATSPVLLNRYPGHLSLTFIFPMGLAVGMAARWLKSGSPRCPGRTAAVLILAYFCSAYFLVASGIILASAAAWCVWRSKSLRSLLPMLGALAITVGALSPLMLHRLSTVSAEKSGGFDPRKHLATDYDYYSADVTAIAFPKVSIARPPLLALPGMSTLFARTVRSGEGFNFAGWLLLGGLGSLIALKSLRPFAPLLVGLLLLYLMTLGPSPHLFGTRVGPEGKWLPYALADELPLISSLRAAGRFGLAIPGILLLGVAGWMATLRSLLTRRSATILTVTMTTILMLASIAELPGSPPSLGDTDVRAVLKSAAARAATEERIAVVPMCDGPYIGPETLVTAFVGLPAVGCHAQYLNTPFFSQLSDYRTSRGLAALRCAPQVLGYAPTAFGQEVILDQAGLEELQNTFKIRFLVVDLGHMQEPNCAALQRTALPILRGLPELAADHNWMILDLKGRPNDGS